VPNSRLDLSCFQKNKTPPKRSLLREPESSSSEVPSSPPSRVSPQDTSEEKSTFIPVGFHRSHLTFLEKVVFELKKEGHKKASKSALIRILIESHGSKAAEEYRKRHTNV